MAIPNPDDPTGMSSLITPPTLAGLANSHQRTMRVQPPLANGTRSPIQIRGGRTVGPTGPRGDRYTQALPQYAELFAGGWVLLGI